MLLKYNGVYREVEDKKVRNAMVEFLTDSFKHCGTEADCRKIAQSIIDNDFIEFDKFEEDLVDYLEDELIRLEEEEEMFRKEEMLEQERIASIRHYGID